MRNAAVMCKNCLAISEFSIFSFIPYYCVNCEEELLEPSNGVEAS